MIILRKALLFLIWLLFSLISFGQESKTIAESHVSPKNGLYGVWVVYKIVKNGLLFNDFRHMSYEFNANGIVIVKLADGTNEKTADVYKYDILQTNENNLSVLFSNKTQSINGTIKESLWKDSLVINNIVAKDSIKYYCYKLNDRFEAKYETVVPYSDHTLQNQWSLKCIRTILTGEVVFFDNMHYDFYGNGPASCIAYKASKNTNSVFYDSMTIYKCDFFSGDNGKEVLKFTEENIDYTAEYKYLLSEYAVILNDGKQELYIVKKSRYHRFGDYGTLWRNYVNYVNSTYIPPQKSSQVKSSFGQRLLELGLLLVFNPVKRDPNLKYNHFEECKNCSGKGKVYADGVWVDCGVCNATGSVTVYKSDQ
ncbi:MAG TPA: hypothetical protein PLP23_06590 [Panacibacter sp.]|nr:hypothetical protein [Panacibacter sp.]